MYGWFCNSSKGSSTYVASSATPHKMTKSESSNILLSLEVEGVCPEVLLMVRAIKVEPGYGVERTWLQLMCCTLLHYPSLDFGECGNLACMLTLNAISSTLSKNSLVLNLTCTNMPETPLVTLLDCGSSDCFIESQVVQKYSLAFLYSLFC